MAVVTVTGCAGCGACLLTCPTHAIRPDGGRLYVLADRCINSGRNAYGSNALPRILS